MNFLSHLLPGGDAVTHAIRDTAADAILPAASKRAASLAKQYGSRYLGDRAGDLAGQFASEVVGSKGKALLNELLGSGRTDILKAMLRRYKEQLRYGTDLEPLEKSDILKHLPLVGVDPSGFKDASRAESQRALNRAIADLWRGKTGKQGLIQLLRILDNYRNMAGKDSLLEHARFHEHFYNDPSLRQTKRDYFRPPPKRRKGPKRAPSAYNNYMGNMIKRLKASDPGHPHKEYFTAAAQLWGEKKREGVAPEQIEDAVLADQGVQTTPVVAEPVATRTTRSGTRQVQPYVPKSRNFDFVDTVRRDEPARPKRVNRNKTRPPKISKKLLAAQNALVPGINDRIDVAGHAREFLANDAQQGQGIGSLVRRSHPVGSFFADLIT